MDWYRREGIGGVINDLLVEVTGHHQGHYLALTGGEGLQSARLPQRLSFRSCAVRDLERGLLASSRS
jgi:hypothetical protein